MNNIDIIIPTMWRDPSFISALSDYVECPYITRIILIDNDYIKRPTSEVFKHPKITLVNYGRNLYVNPSWNEGYYRSTSTIIGILNDDINVHSDIFKLISERNLDSIGIIGVSLKGAPDNYTIDKYNDSNDIIVQLKVDRSQPIGGQAWAFGICMFMKRIDYRVIPSLYQVWFGDDYLVQRINPVHVLRTNKIKGKISSTLVALNKSVDVQNRINLDSQNVYKFNHFKNGKNWDLIRKIMNSKQMIFLSCNMGS